MYISQNTVIYTAFNINFFKNYVTDMLNQHTYNLMPSWVARTLINVVQCFKRFVPLRDYFPYYVLL